MLKATFFPAFSCDLKKLDKKHVDTKPLNHVINLVLDNTQHSINELKRHHNVHLLKEIYAGCNECHVASMGDWLFDLEKVK